MHPSGPFGGNPFDPQGGGFGGGFGSEPPADGDFGFLPGDGDEGLAEFDALFGGDSGEKVIGIGLHFYEKMRQVK